MLQYASIYSTVTTTAISLRFAQPRTNASGATHDLGIRTDRYDAFTKAANAQSCVGADAFVRPAEQKRRVPYASIYSTVTTTAISLRFAQPRTNASGATHDRGIRTDRYDAFTKAANAQSCVGADAFVRPGEQKRRVQYASIYSTVTTTATSLRFAQPRTNASGATQFSVDLSPSPASSCRSRSDNARRFSQRARKPRSPSGLAPPQCRKPNRAYCRSRAFLASP